MSGATADLEAGGKVAFLAALPGIGPALLGSLLAHHSLDEAIAVVRGDLPGRGPIGGFLAREQGAHTRWPASISAASPERHAEALARTSTRVLLPGDPEYPPQLLDDPRRPAALFVRGDVSCLDARRVGVVGTRNATQQGRLTARRIGRELAAEGVSVVSGLALGIDGASHEGVLAVESGRPVGVVGSGPDVPYPRRHGQLWDAVVRRGVLISEWPPGSRPEAYRFPLRNRILAALSEVLVVVESRERGGSLITADEAAARGVDVFAVPGSLNSPASVGTVQLIRDGASIFTDTADVLAALGLDTSRAGRAGADTRPVPTGLQGRLLAECRAEPLTIDRAALLLDVGVAEVAIALTRLEVAGWIRNLAGWYEAVDPS